MKTVPVNELSGPALDWAVAVAEDKRPHLTVDNQVRVVSQYGEDYSVSFEAHKRWGIAGPIIEREGIGIIKNTDGKWVGSSDQGYTGYVTNSPLVSAMRCYVDSKLGDTVSVPAVLLEGE